MWVAVSGTVCGLVEEAVAEAEEAYDCLLAVVAEEAVAVAEEAVAEEAAAAAEPTETVVQRILL